MAASEAVLFVCSTATHVRMFVPVARLLEDAGAQSFFLSLDEVTTGGPGGGVRTAWTRVGEPVPLIELDLPLLPEPIYSLSKLGRFLVTLRLVEPAARRVLERVRPVACVLGNDQGLAERTIIAAARALGCRTIVIQDGFLPVTWRDPRKLWWRRGIGAALAGVGKRHLLSGPFGTGGCDVIGVMSALWREILISQGITADRVVVVGSTMYESLLNEANALRRRSEEAKGALGLPRGKRLFTFFTCNFKRGLKDQKAHRLQLDEIATVYDIVRREGWGLLVKLHPADDPADYESVRRLGSDVGLVKDDNVALVLHATDMAVTTISAVAVEAYLWNRPCLLARHRLAQSPYARFIDWLGLPGYCSPDELRHLIQEWDHRVEHLLAQGRKRIADFVSFDPQLTSAERIFRLLPVGQQAK